MLLPPNPELGTLSPTPGLLEHGVQGPFSEAAVKTVNGTTSLTTIANVPSARATTELLWPWRDQLRSLVAIGEPHVAEGAERAAIAHGVNGIGGCPGGESGGARPSVGEQVPGAVRGANDPAIPIVEARRVFRALDSVARIPRHHTHACGAVGRRRAVRGASPRLGRERARDGRRLEVVDEGLGRLGPGGGGRAGDR